MVETRELNVSPRFDRLGKSTCEYSLVLESLITMVGTDVDALY